MAAFPCLLGSRRHLLACQSLGTQGYPYSGAHWMLVLSQILAFCSELLTCHAGYATVFGFISYTIALLVKAPKADAQFVFVETNNQTG